MKLFDHISLSTQNGVNNLSWKDFFEQAPFIESETFYCLYAPTDPLLALEFILACWKSHKTPVLLSEQNKESFKDDLTTHFPKNFESEVAALILLTSGSTGTPKNIVYSFSNLYYSALGSVEFYKWNHQTRFQLTLPLYHIGGFMIFFRAFLLQARLDLSSWKSPKPQCVVSYVPYQLKTLIDQNFMALKQLKFILLGGDQADIHLLKKAQTLPISITYGLSESTAQISAHSLDHVSDHFVDHGVMGDILPYREVKIIDGIIAFKGQTLFLGHFINKNLIKPVLDNGYYKTSDVGQKAGTSFKVQGRNDLIFISGGKNISPIQIEQLCKDHFKDQLQECLVVPVSDSSLGKVGYCFYEGQIEKQQFFNLIKQHLGPHFIPKYFSYFSFSTDYQEFKMKRSFFEKLAILKSGPIPFYHWGNPSKQALVFFHGFMGHANDWETLALKLQKHFFILAPFLPGHGGHLVKDLESSKEDLISFINTLHDPVLYGYSMGGRVLLEIMNQVNFGHLYLESTHPGLDDQMEKHERIINDGRLLEGVHDLENYKFFLNQWYQATLWGDLANHHHFQQFFTGKVQRFNELEEWKKSLNVWGQGVLENKNETLQICQNKLTLITGKKDHKYTSIAQFIKNKINPEATVINHEHCGHNIHFEDPDFVCEILTSGRPKNPI